MTVNLVSPSEYSVMTWKNGKGKTTELMCEKDGDDQSYLWRLSIALVSEDGIFSDFTGYNRTLILIDGNGMSLSHDNDHVDILSKKFDFSCFSGAFKTFAKLEDGPIKAFNVICQNGKYTSYKPTLISTANELKISCETEHTFIYSTGTPGVYWTSLNSERKEIPYNHLLHVRSMPGQEISVIGEGLICIKINASD